MKGNYKYHLEPYSPTSKKTCPKCGRKKCFTMYLDENNTPAGEQYGICDHVKECGYRLYPTGTINNSDLEPVIVAKKEAFFYDTETASAFNIKKYENGLIRFLLTKFQKSELEQILNNYFIGSVNDGIIFWQIDENYKIHRGKIMWYNPDGHRTKVKDQTGGEYAKISMMWKFLNRKQENEPEMCYFGQHLTSLYPDKPVAIVESEKTCLIGSLIEPDFNWIATLSINNFQSYRLNFLKNFKNYVFVFPDRDGYPAWKEKTAQILNLMPGLRISVNDFILEYGKEKEDLADVFLRFC